MIPLFTTLDRALALVGRHAKPAFAVAIVAGLALPWLANAFRPLLPVSIVCFVTLSLARADASRVRAAFRRPARLTALFLLSTLTMPLLVLGGVALVGRENIDPGLLLGLALVCAAPPLMAFPAYALLLGHEAATALALLGLGMALAPALSPVLASAVAGHAVPLDPVTLALRIAALLGTAFVLAAALRRFVGLETLRARGVTLDGLNVVLFFVFAVAAMDGVLHQLATRPDRVALYLGVAVAVCVVAFVVSLPMLRAVDPTEAPALAIGVALRNTGLLVAPMGAAMPDTGYLFFSLIQFPIYFAPLALSLLARRR